MTAINGALAVAGATVLLLGLVAGYVKNRLWMSETTICLLIGILVGPVGLRLLIPAERDWFVSPQLLELARVTLGIAVMGAALRLPRAFVLSNWRDLTLVLGPGLLMMWLTGAALAWALAGLTLLPALVLGAVLAPTDPVVASSVTQGQAAERNLAPSVRHVLTAESGANDGSTLLLVLLPVLLLTNVPAVALSEWAVRVVVWEIGGAIAIGVIVGAAAGQVLVWSRRQAYSEQQSAVTVGLALSLTVLSAVRLIGSDGILAVFVAGLMLRRHLAENETRQQRAQEAIGRFFDLPVFIALGAMLPWQDWRDLSWYGLTFAIAVLVLRRLPWWLILGRWLRCASTWREVALLGWFGPIGVSSIYYAILAEDRTGLQELWPLASLVVALSVVLHGISATPLIQLRSPPP